jgi:transposase
MPWPSEIWEQTPPVAREMMVAQATALAELRAEVAQLKATVEALAQRLGRHSRHSSQLPSADPPQAPRRARREPPGRRPGGQARPAGHTRAVGPVEAVDGRMPGTPVRGPRCQHPLQGHDPPPQRHQVRECPPLRPVVTAYQWHQLGGPAWGTVTRAALPAGGCGPRVQAMTALCTGASHLSKRTTPQVMADLCGLPLCVGPMAHLEPALVQAIAQPVAEARADVPQQPAADLDETGWREGQQCAWRWTAVTAWVTVCVVRRSRRSKVAQELLGERCWGGVVTDRWRASTWYPTWRRQRCWAHLRRAIEAMRARGTVPGDRGRLAEAGPSAVPWVASGPRWHPPPCELGPLSAADPARGRAVAGSGPAVWGAEDRGGRPGEPEAAPGVVAVRAAPWGRAHAPRRGTRDSSRRPLAHRPLWHPQSKGLPGCGDADDRGGPPQTAASEPP